MNCLNSFLISTGPGVGWHAFNHDNRYSLKTKCYQNYIINHQMRVTDHKIHVVIRTCTSVSKIHNKRVTNPTSTLHLYTTSMSCI